MVRNLSTALVAALALLWSAAVMAQDAEPLDFGVVPQQSSSLTLQRWQPFATALEETLGRPVRLRIAANIPTFEACLDRDAFDLAYMNPLHYVTFSERAGYKVVARRAGAGLVGVLVARKADGISGLAALDGERLAFPSPAAFGASILTRSDLIAAGVEFEPQFVRSHESTYRAVAVGAMKAGGGVKRTFGNFDPELRDGLEIIHTTEEFTPHAIAASSRLSQAVRSELQAAILAVAANAPEAMEPLGIPGLIAPVDYDYEDVRGLGVSSEMAGYTDLAERQCPFD